LTRVISLPLSPLPEPDPEPLPDFPLPLPDSPDSPDSPDGQEGQEGAGHEGQPPLGSGQEGQDGQLDGHDGQIWFPELFWQHCCKTIIWAETFWQLNQSSSVRTSVMPLGNGTHPALAAMPVCPGAGRPVCRK
jgi:hypothetical protein